MIRTLLIVSTLFALILAGCSGGKERLRMDIDMGSIDVQAIQAELAKLAPVEIKADISILSEGDRAALDRIIEAARIMDEIFLRQVYSRNVEIREQLKSSPEPAAKAALELFTVMYGPYNRMIDDEPFLDVPPKPPGANYYPEDMTKEEFNDWIENHPEDKDSFEHTFTLIRRRDDGLAAFSYSRQEAYIALLNRAARLLEEAAALTDDPTLARYLKSRAMAFRTNDYFQSDVDWMDLAGDLEVVIGPYEVYEDTLFGLKGAFEAFVCIVDAAESEKLAVAARHLDDMERNLPIPDEHKNFDRGSSSPIKVVNEIFTSGDTRAGIQTTAFNLPNDERVREAKGSKKVMLKNVAEAKFRKCWIPIVNTVLAPDVLKDVSFDAYFNHVLMHEMSHGLGPGNIVLADGTKTSVNQTLKELYSTIEECKADVLGVYNTLFLLDKGELPAELARTTLPSYLGGMFRSVRFGINSAHGGGVMIQFNWMMEKGGFAQDAEGRFTLNKEKLIQGIQSLAREVLMIEAEGSYEKAAALIEKYKVMTPVMEKTLVKLAHVPIDIRPIYEADGR